MGNIGTIIVHEGANELNVGLVPIVAVGTLYGIVTDAVTGGRLGWVTITLDGEVTLCNTMGEYWFDGVESGGYTIIFEKEGYETVTRAITVIGNYELNVALTPMP